MYVFISYSHIDREFVWQLKGVLDGAKIDYFLDQKDINWGDTITDKVEAALSKATHIIIVLSPASIKSNWVSYETGLAKGKGLILLPLLTHQSLEIPSYLSKLNYKTSIDDLLDYFDNDNEMQIKSQYLPENKATSSEIPKIESEYDIVECPFCFISPSVRQSPCPVCNGAEAVKIKKPYSKCRRCNGEGYKEYEDEDVDWARPCYVCGGIGVISDDSLRKL